MTEGTRKQHGPKLISEGLIDWTSLRESFVSGKVTSGLMWISVMGVFVGELRAVALGKLFEVKCYLLGLTAHGAGENAQA